MSLQSKSEESLQALENFLPAGAFEPVSKYLKTYKVHLTITRSRKTVLGDYRHEISTQSNHRISVNGNLNRYAFLITLLHELAHLLCYNEYKNQVDAHGLEWKQIYSKILSTFIQLNIFPDDIRAALEQAIQNPAASSCREVLLMKTLHKYDNHPPHVQLLEALPYGALFKIENGSIFKKGALIRKRFKCTLVHNDKVYLFSPIHVVHLLDGTNN